MFLSGVIWTKSVELFIHQKGRKKPIPPGDVVSCHGRFSTSSSVLLLLCKYIFCYIDKQAC